ncbi:MAG: metal-dependent hydrolase [Alphaproteobacteria bacterium]|nr:metal-dependent hydrolase [Alphaproteobacteria bacterium]
MAGVYTFGDLKLHYLGHSGFVIQHGDAFIAVDPFLTGNQLARMKAENVKATDILVTHGHADHIGDSVEIAKKNGCAITCSYKVAEFLEKQEAKTNPIAVGGTLPFSWGKAHYRTAMHSGNFADGTDFGFGASVLLTFDHTKIYHLGDTALHLDFKLVGEIYQPDIMLVPIGGKFTMNIDEAVVAVRLMQPKVVIPIHYNTFPFIQANPVDFKARVEKDLRIKCEVLDPVEGL